jgi:hypothetical protein
MMEEFVEFQKLKSLIDFHSFVQLDSLPKSENVKINIVSLIELIGEVEAMAHSARTANEFEDRFSAL